MEKYVTGRTILKTKRSALITGVFCISLIAGLPIFSQDTATEPPVQGEGSFVIPDDTTVTANTETRKAPELIQIWDFIRMLLILGAVIAVIYIFFYFLKKGVKKRLPESDLIKVLGFTALRGSSGLYLVELGSNIYLVGLGENGLSLISTITDKETIDTVRLRAGEAGLSPKLSFSDFISNMFKPKEKGEGESLSPVDFLKQQKERIKNLK
jgi:flagellar protein FliO/FliZ